MNTIKDNIVREIHLPVRITFRRRKYVHKGIKDLWEADLMDMRHLKQYNKGYQYILIVVDTFSKYAFAEILKNKTGPEVTSAMKRIIDKYGSPRNLQSDKGMEFYSSSFRKLMRDRGVNHYSTYSTVKASHVERLIRTIKNKLYRQFSMQGSYCFLNILQSIINQYNHDKHRTIGMAPSDVNKWNEKMLLDRYSNLPHFDSVKRHSNQRLKIGDFVRISRKRSVFSKGYFPNWSVEIFKIKEVKRTLPNTYHLEDLNGAPISGCFYNEELKKTAYPDTYLVEKIIRRRKGQILVKWLGFENPSWVNENDVI